MRKLKTAKDIRFHQYTVSHGWFVKRVEELGLVDVAAAAMRLNKAPVITLKALVKA